MTRSSALAAAIARWGGACFAARVKSPAPAQRYVVGIIGPLSGEPLPLGVGADFEAALADAEARGFTREKVAASVAEHEVKRRLGPATRDERATVELARLLANETGGGGALWDDRGSVGNENDCGGGAGPEEAEVRPIGLGGEPIEKDKPILVREDFTGPEVMESIAREVKATMVSLDGAYDRFIETAPALLARTKTSAGTRPQLTDEQAEAVLDIWRTP